MFNYIYAPRALESGGLYDLEADRTELNDLADKFPEKVEQLNSLYESWAKRCGVQPWPINKPKAKT